MLIYVYLWVDSFTRLFSPIGFQWEFQCHFCKIIIKFSYTHIYHFFPNPNFGKSFSSIHTSNFRGSWGKMGLGLLFSYTFFQSPNPNFSTFWGKWSWTPPGWISICDSLCVWAIGPLSEGLVTPLPGVEKLSRRLNFFDYMFSCITWLKLYIYLQVVEGSLELKFRDISIKIKNFRKKSFSGDLGPNFHICAQEAKIKFSCIT